MKRFLGFALILCSLSLPAFAAKNSKDVTLTNPVKVGATQLPAGLYNVSWTGDNSNLQLTIAKNGKAVATVPAKLEPANNGFESLDIKSVNGSQVLQTLMFDKFNLVLSNTSSSGQ